MLYFTYSNNKHAVFYISQLMQPVLMEFLFGIHIKPDLRIQHQKTDNINMNH